MFARLVHKELLDYLLDLRFLLVSALCIVLAALSAYAGGRNYVQQLTDYQAVSNYNRQNLQVSIDTGELYHIDTVGYRWSQHPETLSPVVYGISGILGKEVNIHRRFPPLPEASLFETDAVHAMFEVLDFSFIVKVVLSLAVLLFTYDSICGEKEGGTLRLCASFPVSRVTLAAAKLIGATIGVLVPMVLAFLLICAVLSLSSGVSLAADDWLRMALLMGLFGLYLAVFTSFGLFISSLTHRRMTAFLGLLGLWTIWLFIIPNVAVDVARGISPAVSVYDLKRHGDDLWWEQWAERWKEIHQYEKTHPIPNLKDLTAGQRQALMAERSGVFNQIQAKWEGRFHAQSTSFHKARGDRMRDQQRLAMALSAFSPLSALSYASMDLARTGVVQQERLEDALYVHLAYLGGYILEKTATGKYFRDVDLKDFTPFAYQDRETIGECLARNRVHILNLALLAILGFAGAFVAILRYDVR